MFRQVRTLSYLTVGLTVLLPQIAQAEVVIDTVPIGNVGNTPDTNGLGALDYAYNIGTYEVTAGQYADFLNAVAADDTYGLYSELMWTDEMGCKIERLGTPGAYTYAVASDWANRPVNFVNWGDAARFANWMHNGQPVGPQGLATTEDGSYFVNGAMENADLGSIVREADATWATPTENEWYKAAYYDPAEDIYYNFPTRTDDAPSNDLIDPDPGNNATFETDDLTIGAPYYRTEVGAHENSFSPYGTFDQGGNVFEWNEKLTYGMFRGMRGGRYDGADTYMRASFELYGFPSNEEAGVGFRLVQIPEPASLTMLALIGAAIVRRR